MIIFHALKKCEWTRAREEGVYRPESFKDEGFIHNSDISQIIRIANLIFKGTGDMLILCIDTDRVNAPIICEDLSGSGERFYHIYGELNIDAVVREVDFPCGEDGYFTLPEEILQFKN